MSAYRVAGWLWGEVRQGQRVPVRYQTAGDHCRGGNWYATPDDAYLCDNHGFTITRRGEPKDGPYDIGEVPWVMYYHHSFAVHGAYWHDVFGNVRSHGCTNLAPADARWIFFWTEPRLPAGWHEMYAREGTTFHYTY